MREDERLHHALKNLPRARAAEDFQERLFRKLDARLETRSGTRGGDGDEAPDAVSGRWLATAAAVVLAAIALSVAFVPRHHDGLTPEEQAEVRRLLEQHQRLEDDLASVRRQVQDSQPVLYLEGVAARDGQPVDLVMEMPLETRTASYRLD